MFLGRQLEMLGNYLNRIFRSNVYKFFFPAFWQMGFQFAGKAVYSAVWVASASLFMELLGFSTQKWLTAGGLGTVLLTLAGREVVFFFSM